MTQVIDVIERYYAFDRLDKTSPFYELKLQNYTRTRENFFSSQAELNSLPLRATMQTTDFCNLNCIMCQIHSQEEKHQLKQMSVSEFNKIVEKLFPTLVEAHPTNVGEPLISPWFNYLCQKCKEYGVLLDITSNGTLLTEEKILEILPCLLDIKVSFDGAKKETFEKIRKGANYNHLLKNIENFIRLRNETGSKSTITQQMTLFNFNYTELPDLIMLAKEKGVDKVKAYHVFSYSDEVDKLSLMHNMEQFEKIRLESLALAKQIGLSVSIAEPFSNDPLKDVNTLVCQKCRLPWTECFIDYDGSVYPCHSHNHIAYGNIFSETANDVWNSEYAKKLRSALITNRTDQTICHNCGNNYVRTNREQAVPYNKDDFLHQKNGDTNINWGKRCKQFLLNR